MKPRSKLKVPAQLVRGRERFDKFRKKYKCSRRLPESLWSAAVKLAQTYGANRTARTLRLDYSGLKKRVNGFEDALYRVDGAKTRSGACSKLEQTLYRWRQLQSVAVILVKYRTR